MCTTEKPASDDHGAAPSGVIQRVLRGSLWVGAGTWTQRLIGLVVIAILASRLTARDFGIISVAGLCSTIAISIATQGFADALVYEQDRVREAARTALLLTCIIGAVLGTVLVFAAPAVASLFRAPEATGLIRAYGPIVAVAVISQVPVAMLTRDLLFRRRFIPEGVSSVAGGIVTIMLVFDGVGIWSLVIGDAVREVLKAVLAIAVLPERFGFGWNSRVAVSLWRFGGAAFASGSFEFALQNVDYVLIGILLGPVALGYYTVAFRVAILPFLLVTYVVAGVSFPLYARLNPDLERVRATFRSVLEIGIALTFLLGFGLVFLAPSLQVLGTHWEPSVSTARALGVYVCLRSIAHFISPLLTATGHPSADAALRTTWFALLAGLIATVGRAGIETVGVIQALMAGVMVLAYAEVSRNLVGLRPAWLVNAVARWGGAAALAGIAGVGLRRLGDVWVDDTSWLTLLLLGLTFAFVYALGSLFAVPGMPARARRLLTSRRRVQATASDSHDGTRDGAAEADQLGNSGIGDIPGRAPESTHSGEKVR